MEEAKEGDCQVTYVPSGQEDFLIIEDEEEGVKESTKEKPKLLGYRGYKPY